MINFNKGISNQFHILKRIGVFIISIFTFVSLSATHTKPVLALDNEAMRGKEIFAKMVCSACHQIHGEGAQVGPDLSYVGDKRDRKWLLAHFKDPKSLSPNSMMPPVALPESDLAALTNYMLSLKKENK
ncbi:MAG: cytochrome c [Nitrospirae bacterium]|nr:cytochrome c [Nitrospirota bacterium]